MINHQLEKLENRTIEELSELIKEICKARRFGYYDFHPDEPNKLNIDRIKDEMQDCIIIITEYKKKLLEIPIIRRIHVFYKTQDKDRPDAICDKNGEVVLKLCRICGGTEITLPTNCPGRKLTIDEEEKIKNQELDF